MESAVAVGGLQGSEWVGGTSDTQGEGEDQDAEETGRRVAQGGAWWKPLDLSQVVVEFLAQGARWPDCEGAALWQTVQG